MVKVLWMVSFELTYISSIEKKEIFSTSGGWITSLLPLVHGNKNYTIILCCLSKNVKNIFEKTINGIKCYLIPSFESKIESNLQDIIKISKPDLIHVWGAEVALSYPALKIFDRPERSIIHIQGCAQYILKHYYAGLPSRVCHAATLGELLRCNNISQQKRLLWRRAKLEKLAMDHCENYIGRTDFDKAFCFENNKKGNYYFCNEIMREPFYQNEWDVNRCKRYKILFCQAAKHLKGFHILLEALEIVQQTYKEISVYVAGDDIYNFNRKKFEDKAYWRYLRKSIKKMKLDDKIHFLGSLNERQMMEQMLESNVIISSSSCENSSNFICESLLVGLPVVASDVGGTASLIKHESTGLLYPFDAPYLLAFYIEKVFSDNSYAMELSRNARVNAREKFNKEKVISSLFSIYDNVILHARS